MQKTPYSYPQVGESRGEDEETGLREERPHLYHDPAFIDEAIKTVAPIPKSSNFKLVSII